MAKKTTPAPTPEPVKNAMSTSSKTPPTPPINSVHGVNSVQDKVHAQIRSGDPKQPTMAPTNGSFKMLIKKNEDTKPPPPSASPAPPPSPIEAKPKKKRKPTLKTMHLGDMVPAGTFANKKKGKPPLSGSAGSSAHNPLIPVHLAATQSSSTVLRVNNQAQGSSTPTLDPSDFPALPSNPSKSPPFAVPRPPKAKPIKPHPKPTVVPTTHDNKKPPPKKGLSPSAPVFHLQSTSSSSPLKKNSSEQLLQKQPLAVQERDVSGDEHALLRMMQQGKFVVQNKGRQRIRPRKKKFSALKKKVLQERLQKWRELNPPQETPAAAAAFEQGDTIVADSIKPAVSRTVCLYGYVESEELEDDDEYEEIMSNLKDMAVKVGPVQWIFIPRPSEASNAERPAAFVRFEVVTDGAAAIACWNGLVLSGQTLEAHVWDDDLASASTEEAWREGCLRVHPNAAVDDTLHSSEVAMSEIVLENALSEDDLEDDDCLEESLNDIKALAEKFGVVVIIRVEKKPSARVYILYEGGHAVAQQAALELGTIIIGGQAVSAFVAGSKNAMVTEAEESQSVDVILDNVLTEDDLGDEECLEESLADVRELAQRFGEVMDVRLDPSDSSVRVSYVGGLAVADGAVAGFNGMKIGGLTVSASVSGHDTKDQLFAPVAVTPLADKQEPPGPMFSKDKRIPGQFAECLRVPKIANSGQPRQYATRVDDENVKPLLLELLGELMRLQKRAVEDKNAKARRRLVMGLREVARGIRAHKVKLVVMANNLDEYGVIDQKLQEILDLAFEECVPVFFSFSKRALGKAVGKSIKVAVVGVQSAEGAHQAFKKLMALAPR